MDTPEAAAREIARLHGQNRIEEALALARAAAERFNASAVAQANLGYLLIAAREYGDAREAYERALVLQPAFAEARRGLAVARSLLGETVVGDSLSVCTYVGSGRAVEVLVPITIGRGNLVLDGFFDPSVSRVTKLVVELHTPEMGLPAHDLIFNAIGDADSAMPALQQAQTLLAASSRPVLNAPSAIALTGRVAQASRLGSIANVRVPRIRVIGTDARANVEPPVLLRAPGFHAGAHFERARTATERDDAVRSLPAGDLLAIEFIDTLGSNGDYAKYRVVAIDGDLYPVHLAISHEWKVHYFSAEMAASSAYRERERQFLEEPRAAVGEQAWAALEEIAASTGLQYAGIDFALDDGGSVVLFECNATMAVRYPPDEPVWNYRRPAVDAINDALRAMLKRYSSA